MLQMRDEKKEKSPLEYELMKDIYQRYRDAIGVEMNRIQELLETKN